MAILLHNINYRNIPLTAAGENEQVPVRLKTGDYRQVLWLGFISLKEAKASLGTPVKIRVNSYAVDDFQPRWIVLAADRHIQGCLFREGVYGVLEHRAPRIV